VDNSLGAGVGLGVGLSQLRVQTCYSNSGHLMRDAISADLKSACTEESIHENYFTS